MGCAFSPRWHFHFSFDMAPSRHSNAPHSSSHTRSRLTHSPTQRRRTRRFSSAHAPLFVLSCLSTDQDLFSRASHPVRRTGLLLQIGQRTQHTRRPRALGADAPRTSTVDERVAGGQARGRDPNGPVGEQDNRGASGRGMAGGKQADR